MTIPNTHFSWYYLENITCFKTYVRFLGISRNIFLHFFFFGDIFPASLLYSLLLLHPRNRYVYDKALLLTSSSSSWFRCSPSSSTFSNFAPNLPHSPSLPLPAPCAKMKFMTAATWVEAWQQITLLYCS